MGAKLNKIDKRLSPSPDRYELQQHMSITKSGAMYGFGTEKRKGIVKNMPTPGPGTYKNKSVCFETEKPRFHVGERWKDPKPVVNVPGAGSYDPLDAFSKKNLPSYSMKIKLGSSLASSTGFVPGPGNYQNSMTDKKQAPKYGFGSSTRETGNKVKLNVPGPGSYKLKSSIGDVPEHAMPNRDPAYKFV